MLKEIYETNNIGTLEIVKSLLRINEIEFQIKNEMILQTGSLEALGIQGAIVSVDQNHYSKTKELLIENGLLSDSEPIDDELISMKWLDKNFDFLFFKGQPVFIKLLLLVGIICLLIGSIAYVYLLANI